MPRKKIVQDIVPSDKRSIRNIPIKSTRMREIIKDEREEREEQPIVVPLVQERKRRSKKSGGKYLLSFIIIFMCIAIIGIALSLSYSKATVTITPRIVESDIDGTFTAKKDAKDDDLGYEVVVVKEEIKQSVQATKGPTITTKAKGAAVIYNNFSTTPQKLIAGTRLSNPSGLIYRISSTVTIPGKTSKPGSVEVGIMADQAGEKYNTNLIDLKGDLKIVAYKDSEKYDTLYARLKTDIVGGYSGNQVTIKPEEKQTAIKALQETLKASLYTKLSNSIPKEYVLYDTAYNIAYDIPEPVMTSETSAEITVSGTAHAAIFKINPLIKYIAGTEIKKFPSDTYNIDGVKDLKFSISNKKDFSVEKGNSMIFTLKGSISIIGTIDEDMLKKDLVGVALRESGNVYAKYKAISNARALVTPFWMRVLPNSTDKIIIEYESKK